MTMLNSFRANWSRWMPHYVYACLTLKRHCVRAISEISTIHTCILITCWTLGCMSLYHQAAIWLSPAPLWHHCFHNRYHRPKFWIPYSGRCGEPRNGFFEVAKMWRYLHVNRVLVLSRFIMDMRPKLSLETPALIIMHNCPEVFISQVKWMKFSVHYFPVYWYLSSCLVKRFAAV